MKKILSIALALALCLTAMMGCFVVSAAANTLAVGTADITVGDATADVVVDITSEGVWAIRFDVKSDVALTAVAIDDANFNAELEGTKVLVQSVANDYANNITAAKITLTFATADLAAGSYAVAIENIDAGNYAEAAVAFDTTAGAIVVAEKVVEPAEPVLDEAIEVTFSAGLTETAYISCVVTDSQVAQYADYDVVVTRYTTSGVDYNFKEIVDVIPDEDKLASKGKTYWYYYGIELFSLTVPVNVVVNCKDAEGNVVAYSKTFTTTLKDVLAANYNKSSNAKLKTTITDLINAGAATQTYFTAGKTCDYANLALPNDGWDQTYATAELGELASYNTANNGAVVIASGAAVEASPYVSFNMTGIDPAELDQYTIKMSYYDEVLKDTIPLELALTDESVLESKGKYYAYFRSLAIYATNSEVTAELYKNGEVVSTYSYCFDSFITLRQNHAKLGPVVIALGKLGQSFRTFKGL